MKWHGATLREKKKGKSYFIAIIIKVKTKGETCTSQLVWSSKRTEEVCQLSWWEINKSNILDIK